MERTVKSGKDPLVKADRVSVSDEPVTVPAAVMPRQGLPPQTLHTEGEPLVDVVRAPDGTIRSIVVHCACGREIALQCEYLADGGDNEKVGS